MEGWYVEWAELHCQATGADNAALRALLSEPVRAVLVTQGSATPEELGQVTVRLLARHDTPRFANEHSDAVGAELVRLREERRAALLPGPVAPAGDFAPDCDACGGSGLVSVPVRACVWQGRLVLHPDVRMVVTGAVLCDRPGCVAGAAARERERHRTDNKPRRPTLAQVSRVLGCDPVALLRGYEREQAGRARRSGPRGSDDWTRLVARIRARVQGGTAA